MHAASTHGTPSLIHTEMHGTSKLVFEYANDDG